MKRTYWIAWGLALLLVLSGCGASTAGTSNSASPGGNEISADVAMSPEAMAASGEMSAGTLGGTVDEEPEQGAKLIYRGDMEMETLDFDDTVAKLQALVERCGGHIQSSNFSNSGYRSAEYEVRIPAEQYRSFFTSAGEVCHVTWMNEEKQDVSTVYYDTAGRLKTQQTKLERLQELMKKAETMEDIITLESAISETEYAIDSLSGELRHYDDLVDHSTVTIRLQEVYQLSNTEEPANGFGDRMGIAFRSGLHSFANVMEDLAVGVAYGWIWLVLLVIILVGAIGVAKKRQKEPPMTRPRSFFQNQRPQNHQSSQRPQGPQGPQDPKKPEE